ncbi:hypothetical protein [Thalassovita aquimarina]|uniref:Lipoprotein n=1 Tax=Thalassovita aquimarina TaxID=2785917 RepID=A0ABS5HW12_9RHOB|nr:hypothetical protein [Thalassovita aquimarina]MBR9652972.1 hypothetical protein [Thalassovita aquimarina]
MHTNTVRAVALLAFTSAASCSAVPRSNPSSGARFDPLNARPETIAVAIGVPPAFQLRTGDAKLSLSFVDDAAAETVLLNETVALEVLPNAQGAPRGGVREKVYVLRVAAGDLGRLERAQADILDFKARGEDGRGTVAVEVSGGCFAGPVPETLPVSSWLQTDPRDGFVRLTRSADAFAAFDPDIATTLRDNFIPC